MSNYSIFPVGDSAVTFSFGNYISSAANQIVVAMQSWLQQNKCEGVKDIIVAYSSLTVFYDVYVVKKKYVAKGSAYEFISGKLLEAFQHCSLIEQDTIIKHIPVCYEEKFAPDLGFLAEQKHMSVKEVIRIHTSELYQVYMIGFLPGFPYMASVHDSITISRKTKPVKSVRAGSVGIAGKQTGIYPLDSPGGWQIIGRTPLQLFPKSSPDKLLIRTGDLVRFYPITGKEFSRFAVEKN